MASEAIDLTAGDYRMALEPARGGSVARFDWRGEPLFRPTCGPSILDTACFPLVPFSNRIAQGRFHSGDDQVQLSSNFPGVDHPHTLHGFGWLTPWEVVERSRHRAVLYHTYAAAEWPWAYGAEQCFEVTADGLMHSLSITNRSGKTMPAGLGFHPYFPRTPLTCYHGLHRGEWQTASDGLPLTLDDRDVATDWWKGQPAADRAVDTVYAGREGLLGLAWPERGIVLTLAPSENLDCTVVYTPVQADFLCIEPVSHATDVINRPNEKNGMQLLAPGESVSAHVQYRAQPASYLP